MNIALYRAQADPRRLARVGAYGPYWSFLVRLMGLVAEMLRRREREGQFA